MVSSSTIGSIISEHLQVADCGFGVPENLDQINRISGIRVDDRHHARTQTLVPKALFPSVAVIPLVGGDLETMHDLARFRVFQRAITGLVFVPTDHNVISDTKLSRLRSEEHTSELQSH